jgi:TPR repeat protein
MSTTNPDKSLYLITIFAIGLLSIVAGGILWTQHSGGANQLQDVNDALSRHDYPAAQKILQPQADQGNAAAQERMGDIYLEGLGVKQDDAEAMKWYIKAADQKNVEALLMVAGKDNASWFKYNKLGGMPIESAGPHDLERGNYKDALKELQPYAVMGSAGQEEMIGRMYENGLGVDKDNLKAYIWYSRVESTEQIHGIKLRDQTPKHLQDIAATLPPEQLQTAKRIAALWNYGAVPRSSRSPRGQRVFDMDKQVSLALDGNQESRFELGYRSEMGDGMKQDYQEAYFWYKLGSGSYGHPPGAYLRGEYMSTLITADQITAQDQRIEDWKKAHPVNER